MRDRRVREIVVGAAIALLMFGTVPLAQMAGRLHTTGSTGHAIADSIGAVVTNVVETHKRMSIALSNATR